MNTLLSTKTKIKINRVLWVGIAWGLLGSLEPIITWSVVKSYYMPQNNSYNFYFDLTFTPIAFFFGGLSAGTLLVFILKGRWNKRPFWVSFTYTSLVISIFHIILSWVTYIYMFSYELDMSFLHPVVREEATKYLMGPSQVKNSIFIMMLTMGTIFWIKINHRYGPGNLLSSFIGKYHLPKEEERIFMFLDMQSSTTIAEHLGHIRFHQFLDDFFRDISDPILYSKGEVYQYIGDEVIISWTLKNGLANSNCIQCFYEIRKALKQMFSYYQEKYDGIFPKFKAGLHLGKVTTGEIGEIKRDLVHTGDVMNTTARIQAKCNELNTKILISEDLLERLLLLPAKLTVRKVGKYKLRGKKDQTTLYTLEERNFGTSKHGSK